MIKRATLKLLKWILFVMILLMLVLVVFMYLHPVFGGRPDAQSWQKMVTSKHFNGEFFVNLEPTSSSLKKVESGEDAGLISFIFPPKGKLPSEPLPTIKLNKKQLKEGDFVWFGHSSALFVVDHKVIMVDPVYHNASPIPYTIMPFKMTNRPSIEELPMLDAVLISHDHYDHLDYAAIVKMNAKVKHFYVPLGIKAHLQRWGVNDQKITEMDWYDHIKLSNIDIILTPSRHFSGRGFNDRNKTLWGSWVVKSPSLSLFFSGDSGYGKHYAQIGERFGGFDIALMEDGQYNKRWDKIHMLPEQSVQAVLDLKANYVLPIHWGKFDLSIHTWKEPIQRFLRAADRHGVKTLTPKIGQVFNLQAPPTVDTHEKWWETVK